MDFSINWKKPRQLFQDQKAGPSGLIKKVSVFQQEQYLANYVQAIFYHFGVKTTIKGSTLVLSGDGRYYSKEAIQIIIKAAAGNEVRRVWVGESGILSTPAISAIVRERVGPDGKTPIGAFILTACHNPGGPHENFGIKFMMENGGPTSERFSNDIFCRSKKLRHYRYAEDLPEVDLSQIGVNTFNGPGDKFEVEIISSTTDYIELTKSIFDFESMRNLFASPKFSFCYDALNGVSGVYAKRIFVDELGAEENSLLNCVPMEDFGGCAPNTNLTDAKKLAARMGLGKRTLDPPVFGAAVDGDGDRYMIFGKQIFVTPSDSVAIIAANAVQAIPYFASGLKGVARGATTSAALDAVAVLLNLKLYEVPTGSIYATKLMDEGFCSLYGDECFQTGCDNIREKDGIWAVLAWLSILAFKNKDKIDCNDDLISVKEILSDHWSTYGRHYYSCYEYQNVDGGKAQELKAHLIDLQPDLRGLNILIESLGAEVASVISADELECKDPLDGSIASKEGIRFVFSDRSRLIYRFCDTGSDGVTIRIYIERYDQTEISWDSHQALAALVNVALKLPNMKNFTGYAIPTIQFSDIESLPNSPRPRFISAELKGAATILAIEHFEDKVVSKRLIQSTINTLTQYTWVSYQYLLPDESQKKALDHLINRMMRAKILLRGKFRITMTQEIGPDSTYRWEQATHNIAMFLLIFDKRGFEKMFRKTAGHIKQQLEAIDMNFFFKCLQCSRRYEMTDSHHLESHSEGEGFCCENCGKSVIRFHGKGDLQHKQWETLAKKKGAWDLVIAVQGTETVEQNFDEAVRDFELHLYDELLEKVKGRSPRLRTDCLDACEQSKIFHNNVSRYKLEIIDRPDGSSSAGFRPTFRKIV